MIFASEDSYFFDQAPFRQPQKRVKKNADELPQSLRYAHLNPKLASFYKDSKNGEEEGAVDIEGMAGAVIGWGEREVEGEGGKRVHIFF